MVWHQISRTLLEIHKTAAYEDIQILRTSNRQRRRQVDVQSRQAHRQTDRHTDRQAHRRTDRHTDRQTGMLSISHTAFWNT